MKTFTSTIVLLLVLGFQDFSQNSESSKPGGIPKCTGHAVTTPCKPQSPMGGNTCTGTVDQWSDWGNTAIQATRSRDNCSAHLDASGFECAGLAAEHDSIHGCIEPSVWYGGWY